MGQPQGLERMRLTARPENACFGCGGGNPRGLKLEFDAEPALRKISGRFRLGAEYQGGGGNLHGGIIALLLDEAMGKLCRFSDVRAVTAELSVEYLKPIRAEEEISVAAFEDGREGRRLYHRAEIRDSAGTLLARGKGRFVIVQARGKPEEGSRATV
jgi:uncharacterized protein (TIGR00369 family)